MTKEECLTHFFGACVQSEEQARDLILAWGIGEITALVLLLVAILSTVFDSWRTRNTAIDTIDAVLSGKPTKSKHYFVVRSPFF